VDRNKATVKLDEVQSLANIPDTNRRETLNIQYVTFRDTEHIVGWTWLMAVAYKI